MLERLEIDRRETVLEGRDFGPSGPYEQLYGSAHFRVDPGHAANAAIVDLELAPADADGAVHCRADFWLLQPVHGQRGNGGLLYHVVNRGRKGVLTTFQLAAGSNTPSRLAEFGDGLLLELGFRVAAVAWQADVPPDAADDHDLMVLDVPAAEGITGPVACEILVDAPTQLHSLGSRYHHPYEPSSGAAATAVLTVRDAPYDEPEPLPDDTWTFDRLGDGRAAIRYDAGFEPGRIYELVYSGRDPRLVGLGMATTRDFVSFLKYEASTPAGQANPGAGHIDRAHAFGSSQSGRFLRHLVRQGFNQDESARQVFDGLFVNVAGAGQGSFNHRFAQPSRHASAHFDVHYPTEQFPFLDAPQTDPVTGATAGLLDACAAQGSTPKIFYTNTSAEYWNRSASLIHTDLEAQGDVEPPANVRIYHFAGTQHGPGELPGPGAVLPANPVHSHLGFRALFVALDEWVRDGLQPPPSAHATIATGTLVEPDPDTVGWPALPDLPLPEQPRRSRRLDWGPGWEDGIIDREPPGLGESYPIRVPRVDADGNEVAGIRMPEVAVPLGTFTGWRYRSPAMGAPRALVGLAGLWLPFATTQAIADASGDPRPPIASRYRDRDDYVERCVAAAQDLVARRLLLARDVELVAERAAVMYDWTVNR